MRGRSPSRHRRLCSSGASAASLRSRSAGRARVWRVRLGSQPDVERHRTDRLAVRRQPERVGDDETFADLAFHHGPPEHAAKAAENFVVEIDRRTLDRVHAKRSRRVTECDTFHHAWSVSASKNAFMTRRGGAGITAVTSSLAGAILSPLPSLPAGTEVARYLVTPPSLTRDGRDPRDGGGHLPGLLTATPARRALVLGAGARHHILHFRHQRRDVIRNAVLDCPTRCRRRASQRKRPLADPPARARSLTARPLTQRRLAHHHAPIMAPAEGLSSATGLVRHVPARYEAHLRRADGRAVTQEHRALFRSC